MFSQLLKPAIETYTMSTNPADRDVTIGSFEQRAQATLEEWKGPWARQQLLPKDGRARYENGVGASAAETRRRVHSLMSCDERYSLATISNKSAMRLCTRNVGGLGMWRALSPPSPDIFARFQKVNLILDVGLPARAPTPRGLLEYILPT